VYTIKPKNATTNFSLVVDTRRRQLDPSQAPFQNQADDGKGERRAGHRRHVGDWHAEKVDSLRDKRRPDRANRDVDVLFG
jgi:hypothetical protein